MEPVALLPSPLLLVLLKQLCDEALISTGQTPQNVLRTEEGLTYHLSISSTTTDHTDYYDHSSMNRSTSFGVAGEGGQEDENEGVEKYIICEIGKADEFSKRRRRWKSGGRGRKQDCIKKCRFQQIGLR